MCEDDAVLIHSHSAVDSVCCVAVEFVVIASEVLGLVNPAFISYLHKLSRSKYFYAVQQRQLATSLS